MAQRKKKKFWVVEIPLIKEKIELYDYEFADLDGRIIKLDLTRMLRGKSVEVTFKVKIKDDKSSVEPKKIRILPYFIRRIMRKRTDYVEDSFTAETKDKIALRIKPFLITRKRVSRAVRKALQEASKKYLIDYVIERKAQDILSEILYSKMQRSMSLKMKKIYPLAFCDIRHIEIIEKPKE